MKRLPSEQSICLYPTQSGLEVVTETLKLFIMKGIKNEVNS
jgi:hypothetical protein